MVVRLASLTILPLALLGTFEPRALGQQAGGYSAGPGLETEPPKAAPPQGVYETVVTPPVSPEWTQDRTFPGTRFWKLDAGRYEVETWWRHRDPRHEKAYDIFQAELEIGLSPRIQLDIYENLSTEETGQLKHDGNQIEARIAIDPVYGRTPLNPVIYLEWQPRHLHADRAEARLLGGGKIWGPRLIGAVNLFYEQNVTKEAVGFVPNPEMGATAATSLAVLGKSVRAGAETKFALEKDKWSDARWQKQLLVGPNLSARLTPLSLKVYATVLFGLTEDAKKVDSYLILAYGF
jgi:hypothetical protein